MYSKTIEDILNCLEELEALEDLSVTAENQIHTFKFQLRFVKMLLKWDKYFLSPGLEDIRTWIIDIKKRLHQQASKVIKSPDDLLENRLSCLLQIMEQLTSKKQNAEFGEYEAWYGFKLAAKNVVIGELVQECIDPLLEHLVRFNDLNLLVLSNEQFEELMVKLRSVRNFLEIAGTELKRALRNDATPGSSLQLETSYDLLTRIEVIIHNALYLSWHSWAKGNEKKMEELFYHLLVKINHIEPQIRMIYVQLLKASKISNPDALGIDLQVLAAVDSLLDNLQKFLRERDTGSLMKLDIRQIESLHQELSFLKYFLMDPHLKCSDNEIQSFNSLLMQVETIARAATELIHGICIGQKEDHMASEINFLHSDLLKIVNCLKSEIRQMYLRIPKPSISNFPQTPKLNFLDLFLQRLNELLKQKADSISYVKNEIEGVKTELGYLNFFVCDTIKKLEPEEDETVMRQILEVAYEAELVIDLISASNLPNWFYMMWLFEVFEKIQMLRKDCTNMCGKEKCEINEEKHSIHGSPQSYTGAAEEEVVGFNDEAEKIIDRVTRGSKELELVSIVGMPGLGKTTLARKVYDHPSVSLYFHVCSWYCISQVYEKRDLLVSILGDVSELRSEIQKMNNEGLAELLYKSLKGRRYLIVIDDIWNIGPWNDIKWSFPDDCNGSRILFTTRIREVAMQANHRSAPHDLRLFTDEESWELLQNKLFKQRSCPPQLYRIGKEIAKNCKGLPLSVVVIAGVLGRLEEREEHWGEVSESLGKQVVGDSSKCMEVLELSYKHLPDHLKPCFLYLGAFPEDEVIPTWKLTRLWIAEGFVWKSKVHESLEKVAEGYLMDLIARSLVLVDKSKSNGGVKSCRLHDLLHEFSLNKAKNENFLQISREMVNPEQYRYCFYCKKDSLNGWKPHDPCVRSLFFFPTERAVISLYHSRHVDLSVLPYILKLLRVLDLERIPLRKAKFPNEVELLVHLRYLAIQGRLNRIPSSIGKLWRLETLIVVGTNGKVQLPEILLEMEYLKHLCVSDEAAFAMSNVFQPEKCLDLDGIQKLSTLYLLLDDVSEKVIRSLTSLQKLKCILSCPRYRYKLPVLGLLTKLESLNMTYGRGMADRVRVCKLNFPLNLKKLTLSKFRLPWREISVIGRLPKLEVLKLRSWAFDGQRWDVSSGEEFCNLRVLKLENLNIVEWHASPDAFPCLEQLVLLRCKELEEIPSSFGELPTLRNIEVQWCSHSAVKSVRKIQEEQENLGAEGFKVLIQTPDWD